jgi:hypothetical protein
MRPLKWHIAAGDIPEYHIEIAQFFSQNFSPSCSSPQHSPSPTRTTHTKATVAMSQPAVHVTWEDQQNINTFGRLTQRKNEFEAQLKEKKVSEFAGHW